MTIDGGSPGRFDLAAQADLHAVQSIIRRLESSQERFRLFDIAGIEHVLGEVGWVRKRGVFVEPHGLDRVDVLPDEIERTGRHQRLVVSWSAT